MTDSLSSSGNPPNGNAGSLRPIHRSRARLSFLFGGLLFLIQLIAFGLTYVFAVILSISDAQSLPGPRFDGQNDPFLLFWSLIFSILVGLILAWIFGRIVSKPIHTIIDATNALASGKYSTRLQFGKYFSRQYAMQQLTQSFNTMASELESTEMLSSDFINNFSHEFKTPITSIAGFADLLRNGDLPPEKQQEYLEIIANESRRLAHMATNVLNLTKVEHQQILSDVAVFNVSEQIRSCVLLLADAWSAKALDLDINLPEFTLYGNEDLLSQVWLNLLDNAVKFTPTGGRISVSAEKGNGILRVAIANNGRPISEAARPRIYQKFYQGDPSRADQGYGIGLAIVVQVLRLHNGSIDLVSESDCTCFTVSLPCM